MKAKVKYWVAWGDLPTSWLVCAISRNLRQARNAAICCEKDPRAAKHRIFKVEEVKRWR